MATDENPYAPPRVTDRAIGVTSGRHEDLKTVAAAQKSIIVCILLQLLGSVSRFFLPPQYLLFVAIALLGVLVVSTVSVVILARKVGLGIIYGIGTLIPCVGLIILLTVNQKATKILHKMATKSAYSVQTSPSSDAYEAFWVHHEWASRGRGYMPLARSRRNDGG